MLKLKRIKKEEEIIVGRRYLETQQNKSQYNAIVSCVFYIFKSKPYAYKGKADSLIGSKWIDIKYIWLNSDNTLYIPKNTTELSLEDMGVTDHPYNNHKLYLIISGEPKYFKKLSYREIESLAK